MSLSDTNDFTVDPFTQIYNRIWEVLEENDDFTNYIKPGNRIKFSTTKSNPLKKQVINADFPEVSIISRGGDSSFILSSSSAKLERTFSLVIVSGTLRANKYLFPIEWLCLKILYNQSDTLGLDFIKKFNIGQAEHHISDNEYTKGKEGWFSIIELNITIIVPKTDLLI